MPIQKWQAYEQPEADLQRRTGQQIAHGEGIALLHTLGGEPSAKGSPVNAGADGASPAGRYNSTAPYKATPTRPKDRLKHCLANNDTCRGWATASGYCAPHTKSMQGDVSVAEDS